jgi:hypothetical protein
MKLQGHYEKEIFPKKTIEFKYCNWHGEVEWRNVIPEDIWFGSNEWHKTEQWLMKAFDLGKQSERDFALKDILEFKR